MAGVDIGGGQKRRATNSDINMIPFIDLLMVTVAFLLITAVWVNRAQIAADAQVPGLDGCREGCGDQVERKLHVMVGAEDFSLVWKQANTVLSETRVAKHPVLVGDHGAEAVRYPELAARIQEEWARQGVHLDPSDRKVDQAIVHSDDKEPFRELVAVLDAIHGTQRDIRFGDGSHKMLPAFNLVFAAR